MLIWIESTESLSVCLSIRLYGLHDVTINKYFIYRWLQFRTRIFPVPLPLVHIFTRTFEHFQLTLTVFVFAFFIAISTFITIFNDTIFQTWAISCICYYTWIFVYVTLSVCITLYYKSIEFIWYQNNADKWHYNIDWTELYWWCIFIYFYADFIFRWCRFINN